MTPKHRSHTPRIVLTGWNRIPKRYEPLPGQLNLFDLVAISSFEPYRIADPPPPADQPELFDTGQDLPGTAERGQRIIWDVV